MITLLTLSFLSIQLGPQALPHPSGSRLGLGGSDAVVPTGFSTIQAAVRQASDQDGDGLIQILVLPGVYSENVDIRRSNIELRGDSGGRPEIRGGSFDDTLEIRGVSNVHVSGFLITNVASGALGPGLEEGVHMVNTRDCSVTDNVFRGCEEGLKIETSARVDVLDNLAESNLHSGIQIRASTGLLLAGNRLVSNLSSGIAVRNSSSVTIEDNESVGNGSDGFRVRRSPNGSIVLRGNTASGNGDNGALIREASGVELRGNDLSSNRESGLRLRELNAGLVVDNDFFDNREWGIRLRDTASDFGSSSTAPGSNQVGGNDRGDVRVD